MKQPVSAPDSGRQHHRSFIAIPLPENCKQRLATIQEKLRKHFRGVRWVNAGSLHLTLRFLGDQDEETLEQIAVSMLSVARFSPSFKVSCQGLGAFPSPRRARVIWLGVEPQDLVVELYQRLEAGLRECGISAEPRPFSPHLTLGRIRGRPQDLHAPLARFGDVDGGCFEADSVILYESRLQRSGAIHLPRQQAYLARHDVK